MNDPTMALIGALSVGAAWLGKVALAAVQAARRGPSSRPAAPPTCAGSVVEQVDAIHGVVTMRDEDGALRVLNKPSIERAIVDTARQSIRQTELLQTIADSLQPRRRNPSRPGD